MTSFVALNIEPEEDSEDEIDDSKEIQIEEALKLYQNAMKLQSQGPEYFEETRNAYTKLFASEIFTYPESQLESNRLRVPEEDENYEMLEESLLEASALPTTGSDGAPNTLHQILYLSYKNRGQFILDQLKYNLPRLEVQIMYNDSPECQQILTSLRESLNYFVQALERDDTDSELWRLVARVCDYIGSKRIARYCFETVLDTDGKSLESWPDPLRLDQSFAAEQLLVVLQKILDDPSKFQLVASSERRMIVTEPFKKFIDACPYLPPFRQEIIEKGIEQIQSKPLVEPQEIRVHSRTWASCGQSLMLQFNREAQPSTRTPSGARYFLTLPARQNSTIEAKHLQRKSFASSNNIDVSNSSEKGLPALGNLAQGSSGGQLKNISEEISPILPAPVANARNEQAQEDKSSNCPGLDEDDSLIDLTLDEPKEAKIDEHRLEKPHPTDGKDDDQKLDIEPGMKSGETVSLPSRKRSSDDAGIQDNVETGRSRSKRIKARGSVTEPNSTKEILAEEKHRHHSDQLQTYRQADDRLFEAVGSSLLKFNVDSLGSINQRSNSVSIPQDTGDENAKHYDSTEGVAQDLRNHLAHWDIERSNALLTADNLEINPHSSTLSVFLEHSKREQDDVTETTVFSMDDQLEDFVEQIRLNWTYLDQLALKWIEALLSPRQRKDKVNNMTISSAYKEFCWPEPLKKTVGQMLVMKDEFIYVEMSSRIEDLDQRLLRAKSSEHLTVLHPLDQKLIEVVQTIFELHINVYSLVTSPSSEETIETRNLQLDRLGRWAALASDAISKSPDSETVDIPEPIAIRFLWSSVLYNSLIEPAARDHIALCFQDLKKMLEEIGNPTIKLPNNAIMPEISADRADREISRLTTMDFFLNVFSLEQNNSLSIIENLEPILERSIQRQCDTPIFKQTTGETNSPSTVESSGINSELNTENLAESILNSRMQQMTLFLDQTNISFKNFLWQKLRDAYEVIDYPPRVLSCNLRIIEVIVGYLKSKSYTSSFARNSKMGLLSWIRILGSHTTKALKLALEAPDAFESIDEVHLRSSMDAVASLQRIFWVQIDWDDSIRVGLAQSSRPSNTSAIAIFDKSTEILRASLVRVWMLQYTLLKEAFEQNSQLSRTPNKDLLDYLKLLHQALGLRNYCAIADKFFLKFMKSELLRLDPSESSGNDMAQIVYDLYGLKIAPYMASLENHKCPSASLDRETAFEIMDLVMAQVSRMNIKDLGKSELKATIDRMQQAIKVPKATPTMLFNRRTINNFMRSPINPIDLYRSLQGIGALNCSPVNNVTVIGDKGWYFLLGHLSLSKFRSQKRTSAGPIDDLEIASAFLRQDLELGTEKWETWYRLAQMFDARIEEDVGWTAEKLNNHMGELVISQRNSIHCYTMAIAVAIRSADPSLETVEKISDLYVDFALRIYASSREPFSMQVFSLKDFMKHYNGETRGMYEGRPFRELQIYPAWKLACALLRRALVHKSENWMVHYMLGKCLWKMHNFGRTQRISHVEVLDAFRRAIELLPERRDNRHPEKDPTLEPHYKLVSVVHKLVQSKRIKPVEGCSYLDITNYASKIPSVHDLEDWEGYLIHVLKALRSADRSNWHHRMVARAAHTIYDDSPNDIMAGLGAKHELTQQIFTKSMHTQIWRPDNERPGRHFVYTSRYVSFFVRLLSQLNDHASLETLARRIRKRPGDFFNHTGIWEEVCMAYLKILRRHGSILEGNEDLVFKTLPHATFLLNADRLETWAHSPTNASPILDLLREVVELKKLNSNLMKSAPIEDLVGDTYAHLYELVVPELVVKSNTEENRVRMRVDQLLMNTSTVAPEEPPTEPSTKSSRPKSVGRREIQRKAEALIARPALPPAAVSLKPIPAVSNTKTLAAVAIPEREPEQVKSGALLAVREMEDAGKDLSSVPGSLHDSADDESELSEIEDGAEEALDEALDDEGVKVLFPNLSGRDNRGEGGEVDEDEEEGDVDGGEDVGEDVEKDAQRVEMDVDAE